MDIVLHYLSKYGSNIFSFYIFFVAALLPAIRHGETRANLRNDLFTNDSIKQRYRNFLFDLLVGFSRLIGDGKNPQAALTLNLYTFSVVLSVFYPSVFFLYSWSAFGAEPKLGGITLILNDILWARLVVFICLTIIIFTGGMLIANKLSRLKYELKYIIALNLLCFALSAFALFSANGTLAIILLFIVTMSMLRLHLFGRLPGLFMTLSLIFSLLFPLVSTLGYFQAPPYAVICTSLAITLLCAYSFYQYININRWYVVIISFACLISALNFSYWGAILSVKFPQYGYIINSSTILIFFLCALSVVNASIDWISFGISRAILSRILFKNQNAFHTLIWAIFDLLLATISLIAAFALLVTLVSAWNFLSIIGGGDVLFNLEKIINDIRENPWSNQYYWIYLMIYTTLLPTIIHFIIIAGACCLDFTPAWLKKHIRFALKESIKGDFILTLFAGAYLALIPVILIIPLLLVSVILIEYAKFAPNLIMHVINITF